MQRGKNRVCESTSCLCCRSSIEFYERDGGHEPVGGIGELTANPSICAKYEHDLKARKYFSGLLVPPVSSKFERGAMYLNTAGSVLF